MRWSSLKRTQSPIPSIGEQPPRPGDEVVEIGDPGGALGEAVGAGEGLAGAQARGLDRGEVGGACAGGAA